MSKIDRARYEAFDDLRAVNMFVGCVYFALAAFVHFMTEPMITTITYSYYDSESSVKRYEVIGVIVW